MTSSLRARLASADFKPPQGNPTSSRDQEPWSAGMVSLAGCSGEGFLGHWVFGAPLENEDLDAQKRSGREFQAGEQAE